MILCEQKNHQSPFYAQKCNQFFVRLFITCVCSLAIDFVVLTAFASIQNEQSGVNALRQQYRIEQTLVRYDFPVRIGKITISHQRSPRTIGRSSLLPITVISFQWQRRK